MIIARTREPPLFLSAAYIRASVPSPVVASSRSPVSCRDCYLPATSSRRRFVVLFIVVRAYPQSSANNLTPEQWLLTVRENMVKMISDTCGYVPFLLLLLLVPYIESGKCANCLITSFFFTVPGPFFLSEPHTEHDLPVEFPPLMHTMCFA